MSARPLALIAAAAMAGSFFLPWLTGPLGDGSIPWNMFKSLDANQIKDLLSNLPPEGMVFFASFALAALLVLFSLMGFAPKLITLVTGAIPMGFLGWGYYQATQTGAFMGTPITATDVQQIFQELSGILGIGAWAWLGGGAVLLLAGLFGSSRA